MCGAGELIPCTRNVNHRSFLSLMQSSLRHEAIAEPRVCQA